MIVKQMGAMIGNENDCKPMFEGKELLIGIDSSKTNTGINVYNLTDSTNENQVETSFAFNGERDGTTEQDCLELCRRERIAFRNLFKNSYIRVAGIEDIITKEYGSQPFKKTGMTVHTSRFKITAVFGSFISCLQEDFGKTPHLINNWAWKSAILPPEYREKGVYKGSKLYLMDMQSPFGELTDDETDAYCIRRYCHRFVKNDLKELDTSLDPAPNDYGTTIVDKSFVDDYKLYFYNSELSFDNNCRLAISNSIKDGNTTKELCLIAKTECIPLQVLWNTIDARFNTKSDVALIKINYI